MQLGNQALAACDAMGQQDSARFRMFRRPSKRPNDASRVFACAASHNDHVLGDQRNSTNLHIIPAGHIHDWYNDSFMIS